jgi:hypothetical protein
MFGQPFYHKQYKNIIGAFGSLFNNISLTREATTASPSATATATVNDLGVVTSINILTGGTDYTTPPTFTVSGGGTGCKASVTINKGIVTGSTSLVGGTGYPVSSTQTVTFIGGGQPTTTLAQTVKVPLIYASADKAYSRKTEDGSLNYNMKTVKPRMAFNLTNTEYDVDRKIQQLQYVSIQNQGESTATKLPVQPAPYNLSFDLYITTANYEDGLQIIEQILPYFNPEIVIKTKDFPTLNIFKDTPVILQGVQFQDNTPDSDYTEARDLEWTLSFVVKTYFYCPSQIGQKLITNAVFTMNETQSSVTINSATDSQGLLTALLTPAQIVTLTVPQLLTLNSYQIAALTLSQVVALTTDQINGLTITQLKSFTLAQLNAMTPAQRALINSRISADLAEIESNSEWTELTISI